MKAGIPSAIMIAVCSLLGACATVTRGTREHVSIETEPPGATAVTTTGYSCVSTPCRLYLPRKKSFDVTISKSGYQPTVVHVQSKVSGGGVVGFAGNALIGGAVGAVIDASSGATDDLVPSNLKVRLRPQIAEASGYRAEVAKVGETSLPPPPVQVATESARPPLATERSRAYSQDREPDRTGYGPTPQQPQAPYRRTGRSDRPPDAGYDGRYAEQETYGSAYPAAAPYYYAPPQRRYVAPPTECPSPAVDPQTTVRYGPPQDSQPASRYRGATPDDSDIIQ